MPESLEGLVYPYPNLKDYTLDENELERTCPLDLGRHHVDPQHDLGALNGLPLEILDDVLIQLDLRALMDFRAVNQRAMQVVDSIPQFRTIVKHSTSSLRGILSIEAGSDSTCRDLYQALSSARCELCNDFGGYIYLLDCSRVCFLCFSENDRYLPLSSVEVAHNYGLDRSHVARLRRMKSVPGCYSPNEKKCPTRLLLVDRESARGAGIAFHGSALAMEQHVARAASTKLEKQRERTARRLEGASGPDQSPSLSVSGRNGRLLYAKRFMAIVRAPCCGLNNV
ncbi:hypothetical protein BST61_g1250 [Cercospora zeina]